MDPNFQVEIYLHCSHSASKHIYSFSTRVQQLQGKLMIELLFCLVVAVDFDMSFSVHKLSYCK